MPERQTSRKKQLSPPESTPVLSRIESFLVPAPDGSMKRVTRNIDTGEQTVENDDAG
ncbi:hypothetical protein [Bifidobacterium pseudolongum]|uniref:hypothetical protein n=1 Tax=Bifidobacterium pseudolongum TaxID=1694 RepID=UPI0010E8D249|nr:hypothetical protein [Bifidobacterium pseudolongum]RYQ67018.1 hypothetical protein PG2109B_1061 [Bifidobacterium pseudolongum subsp. globosum]